MSKALPLLGSLFLRGLYATLRVRHIDVENLTNERQYILAFWHDHLLLMLHAKYRKPITALVSQSRDGEIMAQVFHHYRVESTRGSSTRGGTQAMRELIRAARAGKNLAFTPDGPKGPARVAKDGVIVTAQATGLPIMPIAFAAKKKSSCGRGIAWSSRCRSHAPSSSMDRRSSCPVTAMSRSGGGRWSGR